jgi:hypothetical protein
MVEAGAVKVLLFLDGVELRTMACSTEVQVVVLYGHASAESLVAIDHRLDVVMAKQFLDRSNIVAAFKQMSRKIMTKQRMACDPFDQSCLCDGVSHGFLVSADWQIIRLLSPDPYNR